MSHNDGEETEIWEGSSTPTESGGKTVSLAPGVRFGTYEVIARLGAGGMGEVWRAWDPSLEREVALKVLPSEMTADDSARARLLREARMASKLNHPNVCTIYEVGEAEGQTYIAMELISGETLSERLSKGRMEKEDVLRLGHRLADALAHAHSNGVVHRDFKSANVVITTDGRAKVLDFGLAARVSEEKLSEVTTYTADSPEMSGKIVGTLAYMAPEQLRGEQAEARSDIWALGVVLHEMASGERPFQGNTGFELSSAILSAAPKPLQPGSGDVLPARLQIVIDRCLEKDPGARCQHANEIGAALESALSTQPAVTDVGRAPGLRLAVLPFANLSGDPEQEYLADGFTQELITQLGRLHPEGLSVIARSSVMRYKKGDTPIDQIASELGVDYVLEGSMHREGDRIRINAELIQAEDQTLLWADTYERKLAGILALQSEVAKRVAESLALELLPAEQARLTSARTVNAEAHDAYLKGSYHWKNVTSADLDTAQRYFELALEKDPAHAPAFEGLACVWAARQQTGITPPGEAGPKAKAAALRAIALDDRSAEAHKAMAVVLMYTDWDWEGADREWRRSLDINPNAADAHAYYAHFLTIVGRTKEAFWHSERALELDPFNGLIHSLQAMVLYSDRRFEDALAATKAALALQPDNPIAWNTLQQLFVSTGLHDELLTTRRQRIANDPELLAAFEQGLEKSGSQGAHRSVADLLATRFEAQHGGDAFGVARRYVDAGDYDKAVDWLERAYDDCDPNLPYVQALPFYDPMRSDPRFQELVRRMGLPPLPELPQ